MIFNTKNTAGKKVKVFDHRGVRIPGVKKYNTRTRELELILLGRSPKDESTIAVMNKLRPTKQYGFRQSIATIKVKIPGSYIVVSGKKY